MTQVFKLISDGNKFPIFKRRLRILFIRHPEWLVWTFSLIAWVFIFRGLFVNLLEPNHPRSVIYCAPEGTVLNPLYFIQERQDLFLRMLDRINNGLLPWLIMVIAMMFPLLNDPIRHVAFSIKSKNRFSGILIFLIGYSMPWMVVSVAYLSIPLLLEFILKDQSYFLNILVKSIGFFLVAAWVWFPSRMVIMLKCSETIPICIEGWQLHSDCWYYGVKTGLVCLKLCWPIMVALVFSDHSLLLMFIVTLVLILERYLLMRKSKLPGYIFLTIGTVLLAI